MIRCPVCNHANDAGTLTCGNCGADLYESLLEQVSTRRLNHTDTRDLGVELNMAPSSNPIVIYVSQANEPLAVDRIGSVVVGRLDPRKPDSHVDIDLDGFDAAQKGVSRQHARVEAGQHPPLIEDLNSANGTFVNGQRLQPEQPYVLQSGDEVRLGHLTLRVYYK